MLRADHHEQDKPRGQKELSEQEEAGIILRFIMEKGVPEKKAPVDGEGRHLEGQSEAVCKSGRPNKFSKSAEFQIHKALSLLSQGKPAAGLAPSLSHPIGHYPTSLRTYVQQGQAPVSGAEQGHLLVGREPCHNQDGGQHQGPTVGE